MEPERRMLAKSCLKAEQKGRAVNERLSRKGDGLRRGRGEEDMVQGRQESKEKKLSCFLAKIKKNKKQTNGETDGQVDNRSIFFCLGLHALPLFISVVFPAFGHR